MKYPKKSPEGFSERVKALKCICLDAEKIAESAFSKYRRNDPVYGWQWSRSCPLEAAGKTVGDYLQGYLEKSMSPQHGAMYWATGIRNWTCSGTLSEKNKKKAESIRSPTKRYFLTGVISALTGFRSSHRKDSTSPFSHKPATDKPNRPNKEKAVKPEKLDLSFKTASMITQAYLKHPGGYNTASLRDSLTQAERVITFQAKPVRSLEEDPILKHRRREPLPSEKEIWKQDLVKQSRGL